MPKAKTAQNLKLQKCIDIFGSDIFSTDGSVLLCKLCSKVVCAESKDKVQQHVNGQKHKTLLNRQEEARDPAQTLLRFDSNRKSTFSMDLCRAMVHANIPFYKLENPTLRSFLAKYTNQMIPDESTLRKGYLKTCYEDTMQTIRNVLKGQRIWISIDETTDSVGRYIANVIVGLMSDDEPQRSYLLHVESMEKANHTTIAKLFDDDVKLIDPEFNRDHVLLFVTDAAPYMVKAAKGLQMLYTKMVHVTCLAHGLHRVAEHIRSQFCDLDRLVSRIKKVFLKSPSRVSTFKGIQRYTVVTANFLNIFK